MSEKIDLSKPKGHDEGCTASSRFPHRIGPEDIRVGDKIRAQTGDIERIGVVGEIDSDGERPWFKTTDRQLIGVSRPDYVFTLLDRPGPADHPRGAHPDYLRRIRGAARACLRDALLQRGFRPHPGRLH